MTEKFLLQKILLWQIQKENTSIRQNMMLYLTLTHVLWLPQGQCH